MTKMYRYRMRIANEFTYFTVSKEPIENLQNYFNSHDFRILKDDEGNKSLINFGYVTRIDLIDEWEERDDD